MKQNIKFIILFFALVLSSATMPKQVKAQQFGISFQTFYDELSPYGEWVNYPQYGYVWIPDAGPDFVPYSTNGDWVYTEYGWTWVSNYDWGWAPFHYGRWDYDNNYGWLWVPGDEWGPSWVTWVQSDGYYGWQPMQPGISISLSFGRDYRNDYDHWTFVRERDFDRSDIQRYYVNRSDHERIMRNSNVIHETYNDRGRNTTYISGPARTEVQRYTGKTIRPVSIRENKRPEEGIKSGRLNIYRPEIKRNDNRGEKPAPRHIVDIKEVKRQSERTAPTQQRNLNRQENNSPERQQNSVTPKNNDRNRVQPYRQQNASPVENNRTRRQQRTVIPQKTENKQVQPAQQRNARPVDTQREQRQQNAVPPQNNGRQTQPTQQPDTKPAENRSRQQQKQTVTQPRENNQVQPAQQKNERPVVNKRQVRPAKAERKQNSIKARQAKAEKDKTQKE